MRIITFCAVCGSKDVDYLLHNRWYCNQCRKEQEVREQFLESPYERTKREVYATGNKWAIENFNATH